MSFLLYTGIYSSWHSEKARSGFGKRSVNNEIEKKWLNNSFSCYGILKRGF